MYVIYHRRERETYELHTTKKKPIRFFQYEARITQMFQEVVPLSHFFSDPKIISLDFNLYIQ